jgi:hypothetical protein
MAARGRLLLSCFTLGALLLVASPPEAAADKYIVVMDIEGERGKRIKTSLTRMVKSQHKVMRDSNYHDMARRLRAKKLIPVNVKKVCASLKADGLIDGTLVKMDGRYRLTLRVRSGATGAITKTIPMFINQPSISDTMYDKLEERLLMALDDLPSLDGGGAKGKNKKRIDDDDDFEDDDEPVARVDRRADKKRAAEEKKRAAEEKKRAAAERKAEDKKARAEAARKKKEEDDERRRAARVKKVSRDEDDDLDDDDPDDEGEADDDDDEPSPRRAAMKDAGDDDDGPTASVDRGATPSAPTSPRTTPVLLHAGMSFIGRSLTFRHAGDEADRPLGYQGSPVPGIFAEGEIYPMAFGGERGGLANVGIGFVADRVLVLNSAVDDGMDGLALLATRQSRYGASLLYRHNFGSGPDGVSLTASVGYTKLSFVIDKAAAPEGVIVDVPNVSYAFADPGLGVRIPIAGPLSALVEGKFLAVLDTGEIQQPTQYGAATVTGFDGDAGLEYRIGQNFLARAGARLVLMGYAFKGTGTLTDRKQDGEVDVGGAADRYLGGYLTAGYAF